MSDRPAKTSLLCLDKRPTIVDWYGLLMARLSPGLPNPVLLVGLVGDNWGQLRFIAQICCDCLELARTQTGPCQDLMQKVEASLVRPLSNILDF